MAGTKQSKLKALQSLMTGSKQPKSVPPQLLMSTGTKQWKYSTFAMKDSLAGTATIALCLQAKH